MSDQRARLKLTFPDSADGRPPMLTGVRLDAMTPGIIPMNSMTLSADMDGKARLLLSAKMPIDVIAVGIPLGQEPRKLFSGIEPLPPDLAGAVEDMKLSILRHRADRWVEVDVTEVLQAIFDLAELAQRPEDGS